MALLENFNPRAHAGRDQGLLEPLDFVEISIHAPTRGATVEANTTITDIIISIHAPTRGATVNPTTIAYPKSRRRYTRNTN